MIGSLFSQAVGLFHALSWPDIQHEFVQLVDLHLLEVDKALVMKVNKVGLSARLFYTFARYFFDHLSLKP